MPQSPDPAENEKETENDAAGVDDAPGNEKQKSTALRTRAGWLAPKVSAFFTAPTYDPKTTTTRYASPAGKLVGGVCLIVGAVLLFTTLIELWPVVDATGTATTASAAAKAATATGAGTHVNLLFGAAGVTWSKDTGLIVLALLMGAIGGYLPSAAAFAAHIGNRDFIASWGWWYPLRVLTGAALALITYFVLRAGFLTSTAGAQVTDAYGVAALSGIAGLFSKQVSDKLAQVVGGLGHDNTDEKKPPGLPTIPPETDTATSGTSGTSGAAPRLSVSTDSAGVHITLHSETK